MYGSLADANDYFTTLRFDRQGLWVNGLEANRTACLNEATSLIDNLNYNGEKTDADQENEFPRDGNDTVPVQIEHATYEIAYQILSGRDVEIELENLDRVSVAFGQRKVGKTASPSVAKANGIPSERAWKLLLPFLRDPYCLNLRRNK